MPSKLHKTNTNKTMRVFNMQFSNLLIITLFLAFTACESVKEGDPRLNEYKSALKKGEKRTDWINAVDGSKSVTDNKADNKIENKSLEKNSSTSTSTKAIERTNSTVAKDKAAEENSKRTTTQKNDATATFNDKAVAPKNEASKSSNTQNRNIINNKNTSNNTNSANTENDVRSDIRKNTSNKVEQKVEETIERKNNAVNNKTNTEVKDNSKSAADTKNVVTDIKEKIEPKKEVNPTNGEVPILDAEPSEQDSLKKIQLKKAGTKTKELLKKAGTKIKNTGEKVIEGTEDLLKKE